MNKTILRGVIFLVLSALLWFLAGSTSYGQPLLNPIYGKNWQIAFIIAGGVSFLAIINGFFKQNRQLGSIYSRKRL